MVTSRVNFSKEDIGAEDCPLPDRRRLCAGRFDRRLLDMPK